MNTACLQIAGSLDRNFVIDVLLSIDTAHQIFHFGFAQQILFVSFFAVHFNKILNTLIAALCQTDCLQQVHFHKYLILALDNRNTFQYLKLILLSFMIFISAFLKTPYLVLFFYVFKYYMFLQRHILQHWTPKHIVLLIFTVLTIINLVIMQVVLIFVSHLT